MMLPAAQNAYLLRTLLHVPAAIKLLQQRGSSANVRATASLLARFSTDAEKVVPFPLAQTGEGISECELLQWFVEEGQEVEEFGRVCEVQSDKATIEISSRYNGRIVKLYHQPGDLVKVGATLLDIAVSDAQDAVVEDDTASAPSTCTPDAPSTAGLVGTAAAAGAGAAPEPAAAVASATGPAGAGAAGTPQAGAERAAVLAAPAVRRLARELGVLLEVLPGSGPGGRVVKEDVLRAAGHHVQEEQPQAPPAPTPAAMAAKAPVEGEVSVGAVPQLPAPAGPTAGPTVVPIRGYRRAMVKTMAEAATIPHFHFMEEVAVAQLTRVRSALRHHPAATGVRLTLLPLLVKALSVALRSHPHLNASLAPGGQQLLVHASHNVGVAMATPTGLVVPNIKQVEKKSVLQIAQELEQLQAAAQLGRLTQEQLTGGTITVSNIGTIGGTYATPLVNPPEVAIVALGRVRQVLRLDGGGKVEGVPVMNVSWGADHRVVDGAALAAFCCDWKALLEAPATLLLHLH